MNYKQIKRIWGIPSYRLRLGFFVLLGVTAITLSFVVPDPYWKDLLANFAVTFAAVGFIDFLWDFIGGNPLEARMLDSFAEVHQRMDTLNQSLSMVTALGDKRIGIEHIWATRSDWEKDEDCGLKDWKLRMCQAQEIEIVSSTFKNWLYYGDEFWDQLLESFEAGATFKLLIYDPDSEILKLRSRNEDDPKTKKTTEMKTEIEVTLEKLSQKIQGLSNRARGNFEIRLNSTYYQTAQIMRADNRILVALYLSKKSGRHCPTLQILGPHSSLYETYKTQFETLWKEGKPFVPKATRTPKR